MKPVDRFGRPIYQHIYRQLEVIRQKLVRYGYRESQSKPNLFYCSYNIVIFFADMRGTELVPIWEDPVPLFYWNWKKDNLSLKVRQQVVYFEWNRLFEFNVKLRLSHDMDYDSMVESELILASADWR